MISANGMLNSTSLRKELSRFELLTFLCKEAVEVFRNGSASQRTCQVTKRSMARLWALFLFWRQVMQLFLGMAFLQMVSLLSMMCILVAPQILLSLILLTS